MRVLEFDFPGVRIGTAEYAEGPTGCTVIHFPEGALAAVDVRGGAAALRESTLLDPISEHSGIDALVLAGGSTYGLESASGVMAKLLDARGRSTKFVDIPSVPAAVVYDFAGRENALYPDVKLGALAFERARANQISIGRTGAGANVSVGKYFGRAYAEPGGQGACFLSIGEVRILAVTIVNALGNIHDLDGRIVAGSRDPETGGRASIAERLRSGWTRPVAPAPGNTTISALITNARLDRLELQRIAVMAHTAMGRVIQPFHTPSDGDALFVASTCKVTLPQGTLPSDLGVLGGDLLQKAILSAFET